MTLADWDQTVGRSLQFIEAGAEMAARHARMLPFKPSFETKAQEELKKTKQVLQSALASIVAAEALYESKDITT
jgi:hypothetical protein